MTMAMRTTRGTMRVFLVAGCLAMTPFALAQKGGGGKPGGSAPAPSGGIGASRPTGSPNYGTYQPGLYNPNGYGPYAGRVYDPNFGNMRTMTPQEDRLQRAMLKQRNLLRQKQMLSDSDKLLNLANSIQSEVAAVDGKISSDTEKKAGEVEKLAKSVQKKMAGEN